MKICILSLSSATRSTYSNVLRMAIEVPSNTRVLATPNSLQAYIVLSRLRHNLRFSLSEYRLVVAVAAQVRDWNSSHHPDLSFFTSWAFIQWVPPSTS